MKKILFLTIIALAAIALTFPSCKKDGSTVKHDRLISLLLGKDTLNMYVGETRQVPLTINPTNYHLDSLKWKSSDTTVLSFSNTGLLTAKKIGTSTITVSNLTNTISISALVSVGPAPIDSLAIGLIAYYPFNNNAMDMSGNNYNGIGHNVTAVANRKGVANSAYYFSGDTSSYIQIPDYQALRINNTDYTINAWIKLDIYNTSFSSAIFDKRTPYVSGYYLGVNGTGGQAPAGSIGFGPGGGLPGLTSTPLIDTTKWHMVTIVYSLSNQVVTAYIDGVYNTQVTGIVTPNASNNAYVFIGKDNPASASSYAFKGTIDDIRVYSRVIPQSQVTKLFNSSN